MSIPRLFVDSPLHVNASVALEKDQVHYLYHVMRLKTNDQILCFNNNDGEWLSQITSINKKNALITPTKQTQVPRSEPKLSLCFAPIKQAPLHFLIQKATELGISDLHPVITERTVVRKIKPERLRTNAIEAAEQCERLTIPHIHGVTSLHHIIELASPQSPILYCDENGSGPSMPDVLKMLPQHDYLRILIGPEGGFSLNEQQNLHAHPHCFAACLGPRILRADTAALAAITCYMSTHGDWKLSPSFTKDNT